MTQGRMAADAYRRAAAGAKYRNKKTEADGILFDSGAEARRYGELKRLREAGFILGFARQPSFLFSCGARYRPDFIVWGKDGRAWVEDVKGFETQAFRLKRRMWENEYPHMELMVLK